MIATHNKPWKLAVQVIIWATIAILISYDIVAAFFKKLTLSEVIQPYLLNHVWMFAAAFFLMGHLAWPQYIEKQK